VLEELFIVTNEQSTPILYSYGEVAINEELLERKVAAPV
jgi:hypothetical protein